MLDEVIFLVGIDKGNGIWELILEELNNLIILFFWDKEIGIIFSFDLIVIVIVIEKENNDINIKIGIIFVEVEVLNDVLVLIDLGNIILNIINEN